MKTILLCEDDPDMVRLIQVVVERAGYALKVVPDGQQAIVAGLKESPDLVLMDLRMPRLDGVAAIRALRKGGYTRPIVALTAADTPEDRERVREAGGTAFILKTLVMSDVAAAIERLIGEPEAFKVPESFGKP